MNTIQRLDQHLQNSNIYDDIRRLLGTQGQRSAQVEQIMQLLQNGRGGVPRPSLVRGKRYLVLRVNRGKAFVNTLVDREAEGQCTLRLLVYFGNNVYQSSSVSYVVEPLFDETFFLPLQDEQDTSPMVSLDFLTQSKRLLHLMLVKEDTQGRQSILAFQQMEWRGVLVSGDLTSPIEMLGGDDFRHPVGLLCLELEIRPLRRPNKDSEEIPIYVEQKELNIQIQREKALAVDIERQFYTYAKAWWADFQQSAPQFQTRPVRLFALDSCGVRRFASTFVRPLRAQRCLASPLHAARMVRLIPYKTDGSLGSDRSERWASPYATLAKNRGDVQDHALLLCSLLLGFGLDAFTCVGIDLNGEFAMWVLTRDESNPSQVCFWDSVTGLRYTVMAPAAGASTATPSHNSPFRSIHCVFNHQHFYANVQTQDHITLCRWNFSNSAIWKPLNEQAIALLPRDGPQALLPAWVGDTTTQEDILERKLKGLLSAYRQQQHQLHTAWADDFAYILGPALHSYEHERVTGDVFGSDQFQQAIQHSIPVHHIFKAVPMQFTSFSSPTRVWSALLASPECVAVLDTRGHNLRFGLRVKIFPYAQEICAVWVILAAKYRE
jgi:centrosomal protein CEP76